MPRRSLTCVPDHRLLRDFAALVARDRSTTAELLDHLAEMDERKLHLPAGYPSMYQYCVHEHGMSEDMAFKRLRAARAAREFPAILPMVEDGRLHLTAIVCLAPNLTQENSTDLLAAAANCTKAEIEQMLAERFPSSDVPAVLTPVTPADGSATPRPAGTPELDGNAATAAPPSKELELVPEPVVLSDDAAVAQPMVPLPPRPRVTPLAPERFALQVTLSKATHDKLVRAQELLSHALPCGDIAEVLDRALDALIAKGEKKRFAATGRPSARRRSESARHIPAHVRREVSERDRYQCTFVSAKGRRCAERRFLEFDHVHPVARGGRSTVENVRLRCRAHNQYEAERTFGGGFMRDRRERARTSAGARGAPSASHARN